MYHLPWHLEETAALQALYVYDKFEKKEVTQMKQ